MSEYYRHEIKRLKQEKSLLLTKIGQSIYYQFRIGQIYSDELKDFNEKIAELDQSIHQLEVKLDGKDHSNSLRCQCGHLIEPTDTYCAKCGEHIKVDHEDSQSNCDSCSTTIMVDANFCHVCGSRQERD